MVSSGWFSSPNNSNNNLKPLSWATCVKKIRFGLVSKKSGKSWGLSYPLTTLNFWLLGIYRHVNNLIYPIPMALCMWNNNKKFDSSSLGKTGRESNLKSPNLCIKSMMNNKKSLGIKHLFKYRKPLSVSVFCFLYI